MAFGDRPFGLNQIKIVSLVASPTTITLPVARTMKFTPRMMGGELKGSDKLASVAAIIEALEWELDEGGLPLDAIALITGFTLTASGTTPNQASTLRILAATAMPYFKIYGKALGEGIDDVHVKIPKAKLTGNIDGQFAYGEFYAVKLSGIAVDDGTNGLVDIVQHETAVALPST